jgi:inner membrane protein YidH
MADSKIPADRRGTEFLANERTFLAWIRTSVAVISLGFVVARFSVWLRELAAASSGAERRSHGMSFAMGEALTVFGGILAVAAGWRYHVVNRWIEQDRVQPDRSLIALVTVSVALFALLMAAAMLRAVR